MTRLPDRRFERGPFDIVGDVHGCIDELRTLLGLLGYSDLDTDSPTAPEGRRLVFVGDLVDRGPDSCSVLELVMRLHDAGLALAVPGNHDDKLRRWLFEHNVALSHGLAQTIAQIRERSAGFRADVASFLAGLPWHLWLDGGALAVAHAGIRESMIGNTDGATRAFCLYGDTNGERDAYGLPVRRDWGLTYRGITAVVYGHTPVAGLGWVNNTLCIDTGCCFGGSLTALRWPERTVVSVPAIRSYAESKRPFRVVG